MERRKREKKQVYLIQIALIDLTAPQVKNFTTIIPVKVNLIKYFTSSRVKMSMDILYNSKHQLILININKD